LMSLIRINLLPAEVKVQIPKAFKHIAAGLVVVALSLACIGYVWSSTTAYYNEKKLEVSKKEKISAELDLVIKEVNRFKKIKADLEEKLDTIQRLKDNQRGPLRLLTELRDRFPQQVWVQNVGFRKGTVAMKGFGLSLTTVGELVENLKTCKYFGEIAYNKSQSVSKSGIKYFNFDISFPFDPDPERTKAENAKKAKVAEERKKAADARRKAKQGKQRGGKPADEPAADSSAPAS
jgi:Tfp pilus assembly protein PilN